MPVRTERNRARRPRRRAGVLLSALAVVLLTAAGCGGDGGSGSSATRASGTSSATAIGSVHRSGTAPLQVVSAQGETLAVAPVFLGGKGPFPFIVDTGASRSVVDRSIAGQVGLRSSGQSEQVSGVGCSTQAAEATPTSWRVGDVALPATTVSVLDMAGSGQGGVRGLLGSDVLSRFGVVAIDYQAQRLRIGSGAVDLTAGKAKTIPVKVLHSGGAVLAVAPVHVQGQGPYDFIVDSGAATSVLDRDVAQKLGLPIQPGAQASGVACQTNTGTVQISSWAVADVPLPGSTLTTVNLPDSRKGQGLQGLLGSDTLSTFGTVALDYVHQRLLLAARSTAG